MKTKSISKALLVFLAPTVSQAFMGDLNQHPFENPKEMAQGSNFEVEMKKLFLTDEEMGFLRKIHAQELSPSELTLEEIEYIRRLPHSLREMLFEKSSGTDPCAT